MTTRASHWRPHEQQSHSTTHYYGSTEAVIYNLNMHRYPVVFPPNILCCGSFLCNCSLFKCFTVVTSNGTQTVSLLHHLSLKSCNEQLTLIFSESQFDNNNYFPTTKPIFHQNLFLKLQLLLIIQQLLIAFYLNCWLEILSPHLLV